MAAVPPLGAATAAAAVPFALSPVLVNTGILNFQESEGWKIYKHATQALDEYNKYNCEPEGMFSFLAMLDV